MSDSWQCGGCKKWKRPDIEECDCQADKGMNDLELGEKYFPGDKYQDPHETANPIVIPMPYDTETPLEKWLRKSWYEREFGWRSAPLVTCEPYWAYLPKTWNTTTGLTNSFSFTNKEL